MLSLLVNFFREPEKQFDLDEFNDWLQLQGFMLYSPSASKFFKDLQQIKSYLLSPVKLPDQLKLDLEQLKNEFFSENYTSEFSVIKTYGNKGLRSIVTLVYSTINFALSKQRTARRVRKASSRQQVNEVSMQEPVTVSTNHLRIESANGGITMMKSPSKDAALMRGVRTNSQSYCPSYQMPGKSNLNHTPNRRTNSSQSKNSAFYSEQVPSYTPISNKKETEEMAVKKHNF